MDRALSLLAIGMITVFLILSLVVFLGSSLIKVVNKYFPEEATTKVTEKTSGITQAISHSKLAAISAAVDVVTGGQGMVTKIEKKK